MYLICRQVVTREKEKVGKREVYDSISGADQGKIARSMMRRCGGDCVVANNIETREGARGCDVPLATVFNITSTFRTLNLEVVLSTLKIETSSTEVSSSYSTKKWRSRVGYLGYAAPSLVIGKFLTLVPG